MNLDSLLSLAARCDDGSSRELVTGARFVRHLPVQGRLAYLHYFFPPASESQLANVETALGRAIPKQYRNFLRQTNGTILFDKHLSLLGAVDRLSRSLRLEDQTAISLLFENQTFSLTHRTRWQAGWMHVGAVSGWSTQHSIQMGDSSECAVVNAEGAEIRFHDFDSLLSRLIGLLEPLVPCSGLTDGEHGPLEEALLKLLEQA